MLNRIKQIIEKEKLSSTQFATEIGVQRSALSHVLSGRNKPSLDFMMKIKKRYPEINLDWLLLGKGRMIGQKEDKTVETTRKEEPAQKEIPFRIKKDEVDETVENKIIEVKEKKIKKAEEETERAGEADNPKKIILLYPDDTYETFNLRK